MEIRSLSRNEISSLWTIDRSEIIHRIYHWKEGALVLVDDFYDVKGWPRDELERDTALLLECHDNGGHFFGAFEDEELIGAAVLESRFIGTERNQLQLKFLHVSNAYRGKGLGRTLFAQAAEKAKHLGAQKLYISATPSEHTVHFYQSLGCTPVAELNASLFDLEPDDIHMEYLLT